MLANTNPKSKGIPVFQFRVVCLSLGGNALINQFFGFIFYKNNNYSKFHPVSMRFNLPVVCIVFLLLGSGRSSAAGVISAETIALNIARDSGNPASDYLEYGANLARTLRLLSPAQLARVFEGNTTVKIPETLNELLEMEAVNFTGGSAELSPASLLELDKVFEYLSLNTGAKITVEGHAWYDNDSSQGLSEMRALAAKNYLLSKGISASRIETIGYGASRPLVNSPDRDKTTANRRIEIQVQ